MKGLIFTYALTYGGAVLSLYRPFYGLLIYIAFSILKPESLWFWSVPQGNYSRIIAIALLLGWAINGFGNWNLGKGKLALYCFVGYWFWALGSTLFAAIFPERGYAFLEASAKVLLPFMAGLTLIKDVKQLKQLSWVIGLSVAYLALEFNQRYYGGFNQLKEVGFASMDNNSVAIELVTAVGFLFFLGFATKNWILRAAAAGGLLVLINAIMFSFSRGGLLSLIVTAGVAFVLIPKRPVHYAVFLAAVAAGVRLAGVEVLERFYSSFADSDNLDASAQSRLDLWTDCWDAMLKEPLFGLGPDHFGYYAHVWYGHPMGKEAHSLWFQLGAELGFVGVGCLILFYVGCMAMLWPVTWASSRTKDEEIRNLARMVIASLAGFMLSSQFVSLEGLELPYYIVLIGAGTLKVMHLEQCAYRARALLPRMAIWQPALSA